MATFRQRESGYWQAVIRRKGYPVESETFQTKKEAQEWARDIESRIDRGAHVSLGEAKSTTLAQALERYEEEVSWKKAGHDQERYRIRAWIQDRLAAKTLATLSVVDFAQWRDDRAAAGAAAATIKNDLAVISNLFNIARRDWGLPIPNPIADLRLKKVDNARDRRLEPGEEEYLIEAISDTGASTKSKRRGDRSNAWVLPAVQFALETAMRRGEQLGMTWNMVNTARHFVSLPKGLTKNGDARDVPLSSRALAVLSALPRQDGRLDRPVFCTTESALEQSFTRAMKRARRNYERECMGAGVYPAPDFLIDLHFHDLRHEATSRLAHRFQMHELQKITGHKDARMVARYYHPRAEDLAKRLD